MGFLTFGLMHTAVISDDSIQEGNGSKVIAWNGGEGHWK